MQFTKLRLVGFKSFVEPMEFVIEPGLNGIVGPNGCGKSNLVEALRWVMGENSYKNMRASGMEDVIFSGTHTRPSRNWAEVTLTLDNSDHSAPAPFAQAEELQVSRRIERDKGSLYRINGETVRARDVQLLFADQSTGARSPSMVGQGRIGELISAKPQARRALLEEAAGISGLHSRRHEAELRLRAAQSNLERLDDITSELATRIEAVKRQVRQANRFKILSHEIRKNEAGLFYLRWRHAKSIEASATSELNQATLSVVEQAQIHGSALRAQEAALKTLPQLREQATGAGAAYQHLTLTLKSLEEEQRRRSQRRSELMRILEQYHRDESREQQLIAENDAMLARLAAEEEDLKAQTENFLIFQEENQTTLQELQATVNQAENALQILTHRRAEAQAGLEQHNRQINALSQKQHELEIEKTSIKDSLQNLKIEMSKFEHIDILIAQLQESTQILQNQEEELIALEESVIEAREEMQQAQNERNQVDMQLSALSAEERTVEALLFETTSQKGGTLIDEIEVEKGFERAIGAALGDDLTVGLDRNAPLFWQWIPAQTDDPALPAGTIELKKHVKTPPQALERILSQIGLIAPNMSEEEAHHLQKQLKTGQILVNNQGALWRWDGMTIRANAQTKSTQRLAQKNRLHEVKQQLIILMQNKDKIEAIYHKKVEKLALCEAHTRSWREEIKNRRQLCETQRNELENLTKGQLAAQARYQTLQSTQSRIVSDWENVQVNLALAREALAQEDEREILNHEIDALNLKLREDRLEWQQLKAQIQAASQAQSQNMRRIDAIALERKNWTSRIENARQQVKDLIVRREELEIELEDQVLSQDDYPALQQELLERIKDAEQQKQEYEDQLTAALSAQSTLDAQATKALETLSARREARARSEERLQAALDKCLDIERQIVETLQQQPHELLMVAELSLEAELPEISKLEQALERAKIERDRLGAVNHRAEEEAVEMSARFQVMTAERDDVVQAIKKLRQAISNLNSEGRERLLRAFDVVNEQFQRLFTHLFGGGTAQLQLVEAEDPLEAGLEILARPPGKKPQTMTLLSGGEQALTATALIFAVFLTSPAPICVLDEVDAPLDDHNVERYCNLLDEMVRLTKTRFVVITHNPITMARMARLFGVTMGEQGVSQLVSVDLRQASLFGEAG